MLLSTEMLLDVLGFADFSTLVSAKFVHGKFLCAVMKHAAELACRRRFRVFCYVDEIEYADVTIGGPSKSIGYDSRNQQSFAAACRELAAVIGLHAVVDVTFDDNTFTSPGISVIFEMVPTLKYAEEVDLRSPPRGSAIGKSCEAFMNNFAAMKSLRLWLDEGVFRHFSWTFLRQESARQLRLIEVTNHSYPYFGAHSAAEELVRKCATLPRLLGGETLKLDFSGMNCFFGDFGLGIIELLKDTTRDVTFRYCALRYADTILEGGELVLDENEYAVDIDGTTKRYTSEKSGIVVEVDLPNIAVRSTAERRATPALGKITRRKRSVFELVRYCASLQRLCGGESLQLDFTDFRHYTFSEAFGLGIVELLKNSRCELTFRMNILYGADRLLDVSDLAVHVAGTATHYASEESGIVVEVEGRAVAIRSTGEAIPVKRNRREE